LVTSERYMERIRDKRDVGYRGTTISGMSSEEIWRLKEINEWAFDNELIPSHDKYVGIEALDKDKAVSIIDKFWKERL
jgi:hypothetical protein